MKNPIVIFLLSLPESACHSCAVNPKNFSASLSSGSSAGVPLSEGGVPGGTERMGGRLMNLLEDFLLIRGENSGKIAGS